MKGIHLCDIEPGMRIQGRNINGPTYIVNKVEEFFGRKPVFITVQECDTGKVTWIEGRRRDIMWRVE